MGRDVEVNVFTASDRTGPGLSSVERSFQRTQDKIKRESDKFNSQFAKSIVDTVATASPRLAASLTSAFGNGASAAAPLLIAGVAAAAPLVAATLSAAVTAGVSGAVVAGGVLLVADDPRVKAAGGRLAERLMSGLREDAGTFVAPVLAAADKIAAKFDQLRPRIARIFANSSQFVAPLTDGLLRAVDGITRGIDSITSKAKPVMDQFGASVAEIGAAIGRFLTSISGAGPGAAAALRDITNVLTLTLDIAGPAIMALSKIYGWLSKIGATTGFLAPLADLLSDTDTESRDAAGGVDLLGEAMRRGSADVEEMARSLQEAQDAVNGVYQANRDLYASTTDVAGAIAATTKEISKNGRTLDLNTEKGRANRGALSRLAGALQDNYDKYVAVNGAGRQAERVADRNRAAFVRMAEKAGYSAGQARRLADELLNIPRSRETRIEAQTAEAQARLRNLKRLYDQLRSKSITVTTYVSQVRRNKVERQLDRYGGAYSVGQNFSVSPSGPETGTFRTGGPLSVESTIENRLYLDGSLIYEYTDQQIQRAAARQAWRARVGPR